MNVFNRSSFLAVLITTFLMAETVWATTYYVDSSLPGSDSNTGLTEQTPFLTIMKCHNVMVPGDTCLVKNGSYNMSTQGKIWLTKSGTAGSPITLKNYPGHKPLVTSNDRTYSLNQFGFGSHTVPASYWVVEGFELTNLYAVFNCINCNNVTIRLNICHDNQFGCWGGWAYQSTFDRNTVYHNGRFASCAQYPPPAIDPAWGYNVCNQDQGIYVTGNFLTVTNNLIYNNLAYGIQVAGYPFDSTKMAGPQYAGVSNWLIANNTIAYENYEPGIVVWNAGGGASNITIVNNLLYENGQKTTSNGNGILFYQASSGHVVQNNFSYATSPRPINFITQSSGVTFTATGNRCNDGSPYCTSVSTNPTMTNAPATLPASPNFALLSSSPAIDKGLNEPLVPVDFGGTPRPQGAGHDIGAYEQGTSSNPSPAAPRGLMVR